MPCDVTLDARDRNPELMGIRGKEISALNPLPRSCSRSVCGRSLFRRGEERFVSFRFAAIEIPAF